jgi:DNA repair protein RecN (Recombination protein N)
MLKRILVEQFVIIDRLELNFESGLTVLTGETGAGKSILLDALLLVLGDTSSPSVICQGSEQSVIEAAFAPPADNPAWKFIADLGLTAPSGQEIVIRRVIKQVGNDDILLNGKTIELDLLKKIGMFLCEIHGQNANQGLLDSANQLTVLDLSGAYPPEVFNNVISSLSDVHRYKREQEEESLFLNSNIQLLGKMEAMVSRFETTTGLNEYDVKDIKAEYSRLLTAFETSEAFQEITAHLVSSTGAVRILSAANLALSRQKNLDAEKMLDLTTFLSAALENARAAVSETNRLEPEYAIDTKPLRLYKERLLSMQKISEEVQVPVDGLSLYYKALTAKVGRIRRGRERILELGKLLKQSEDDYRRYAHVLTEHRIIAGEALSVAINAELPPLKLMSAQFKVLVEERPNEPWTNLGFNLVTFTARMNPGMPFSPIAETASGGELARLVLAVKAVLQLIQTTPTLIFDEVDTGIGGSAAAAVGERIARLADTTQVVTVTHSPQVASRGDQHLHVSKKTDGIVTKSVIRTLSLDERIDEISRMLAGETITVESRAAAISLIEEASAAAEQRRHSLRKVSQASA